MFVRNLIFKMKLRSGREYNFISSFEDQHSISSVNLLEDQPSLASDFIESTVESQNTTSN